MPIIECAEFHNPREVAGSSAAAAPAAMASAVGGLEFSLFRLAAGADEAALPAAAAQMAQALYAHEPGFIAHLVVRNGAGLYADVVLASDAERARYLCGKWGSGPFDPACEPYLALIDPASVQLDFWSRVA